MLLAELHAVLSAKSKAIPDEVWTRLSVFCTSFDPVQIRYVGREFCRFLETLELLARNYNAVRPPQKYLLLGNHNILTLNNQPRLPIQLMCAAMLRLDASCATFTSTHVLYIRLCLEARALQEALPILDKPILGFPLQTIKGVEEEPLCADHSVSSGFITQKSGLSSTVAADAVHEYYLLGAMVYIGLRRWRNALTLLEHVLVAPTQGVATGPMLEAYRKWTLVALLIEGKVGCLISLTSSIVLVMPFSLLLSPEVSTRKH